MKKRLIALLLAAVLLAMGAVPALAAAPKVWKTEYEGNGIVEVEFNSSHVKYKDAKVVVKDSGGKKLSVAILEKDSDDITFQVKNVKPGTRYTYTISGVRKGSSGSYGSVKGSFSTPGDKPTIKEVEYDREDRELSIEFATRVQYKGLKVVVKDADGRKLTVSRVERDNDEIECRVKGMKRGETYTVTVSGVRVKGKGSYGSASKKFVA